MRILAVHPSALMYTKVFLRLEPQGPELVASAAREAGHEVKIINLQVETHRDYWRMIEDFRPHAVCFSGNYLANVPEIVDLCRETRTRMPTVFLFVGGHSVSFIARYILELAEGAIDCILKGEGDATVGQYWTHGRKAATSPPYRVW